MNRSLVFCLALPTLGIGAAVSCKSDIGLGESDRVQDSPDASSTDGDQNSSNVADDEPDDSTGLFDDVGSLDPNEDAGTPAELVSFDNPASDAGSMEPAVPDVDFVYTLPDPEEADNCAEVEVEATLTRAPADIIFAIDNSGSMSDEISEVQAQINDNFAGIIEESGLDYRVIMVSRYGEVNVPIGGSANPICVSAPLSNSDCSDPLNTPLENNPPTFYHYSANVESHDAWCVLREGLTRSDEFTLSTSPGLGTRDPAWTPLAPTGYSEWLREGVAKSIVVITDESPGGNNGCYGPSGRSVAEEFDRDIREMAPEHFGAYDEDDPDAGRNYRWYSIVGFNHEPDGEPLELPLGPDAPVVDSTCTLTNDDDEVVNKSDEPGESYQELSNMTGGLRFPSCLTDDYSSVFNDIALGVIESSTISCDFDIPDVDGVINPDDVTIEYLEAGDPDEGTVLSRADDDDPDNCSGGQFVLTGFIDGQPTGIELCPSACEQIQSDPQAAVNIALGCLGS